LADFDVADDEDSFVFAQLMSAGNKHWAVVNVGVGEVSRARNLKSVSPSRLL